MLQCTTYLGDSYVGANIYECCFNQWTARLVLGDSLIPFLKFRPKKSISGELILSHK